MFDQPPPAVNIEQLPDEMLLHLITFLDPDSMRNIMDCGNGRFRRLAFVHYKDICSQFFKAWFDWYMPPKNSSTRQDTKPPMWFNRFEDMLYFDQQYRTSRNKFPQTILGMLKIYFKELRDPGQISSNTLLARLLALTARPKKGQEADYLIIAFGLLDYLVAISLSPIGEDEVARPELLEEMITDIDIRHEMNNGRNGSTIPVIVVDKEFQYYFKSAGKMPLTGRRRHVIYKVKCLVKQYHDTAKERRQSRTGLTHIEVNVKDGRHLTETVLPFYRNVAVVAVRHIRFDGLRQLMPFIGRTNQIRQLLVHGETVSYLGRPDERLIDTGIPYFECPLPIQSLKHLWLVKCPFLTDAMLIELVGLVPPLRTVILVGNNQVTEVGVKRAIRGLSSLETCSFNGKNIRPNVSVYRMCVGYLRNTNKSVRYQLNVFRKEVLSSIYTASIHGYVARRDNRFRPFALTVPNPTEWPYSRI